MVGLERIPKTRRLGGHNMDGLEEGSRTRELWDLSVVGLEGGSGTTELGWEGPGRMRNHGGVGGLGSTTGSRGLMEGLGWEGPQSWQVNGIRAPLRCGGL